MTPVGSVFSILSGVMVEKRCFLTIFDFGLWQPKSNELQVDPRHILDENASAIINVKQVSFGVILLANKQINKPTNRHGRGNNYVRTVF